MGNIVTDRSYQVMAEQMIGEALFPTLASPTYDTFPTSRYPSAARFQGADDFAWLAWPNGDGMIRWRCTGFTGPEAWTVQVDSVGLNCEVVVAQRGKKAEGVASPSGQQVVTNDLYKIRECIKKQLEDARLTYGPFGIGNTTTITGQGTSPLKCVYDVMFGEDSVEQQLSAGDDDNLGPNAWIGKVTFTIWILAQ